MKALVMLFVLLSALVVEHGIKAVGEVEGIHFVDSEVDVVTSNASFENSTGKVRVVDGTANFVKFEGSIVAVNSTATVERSNVTLFCENSTVILLENVLKRAEFQNCKVYASMNEFERVVARGNNWWMNLIVTYTYGEESYREMAGNHWRGVEEKDQDGDGLSDRSVCVELSGSGYSQCERILTDPLSAYKVHHYEIPPSKPLDAAEVMKKLSMGESASPADKVVSVVTAAAIVLVLEIYRRIR